MNGGSQHPDKRRAGGHGPTLADQVEHLLPTPSVADGTGGHLTRSGDRSSELLLPGVAKAATEGPAAADADGDGLAWGEERDGWPVLAEAISEQRRVDPPGRVLDWGIYEPAIRRWEAILGRPAPAPTEPGRGGRPRLSPVFVEFLMGIPEGWVTQVPGLSRNNMLKALGNGVVPQQAIAALNLLLEVVPDAVCA